MPVAGTAPELSNNRLRPGVLTTLDVMAQSLAVLGPVMGAAFITSLVAAGAGAATPLAMLLAGLVGITLACVLSQFAPHIQHAGGLYEYVSHSFGPAVGSAVGWMYFSALSLFCLSTLFGMSAWITGFLWRYAHLQMHWYALTLLLCVSLYLLTLFDIRLATRLQLAITAVSLAIVTLLALSIVLRGGVSGHTVAPFRVGSAPHGWRGLSFGLLFALSLYGGFETSATLAEEASNPKRSVPVAFIGSVALAVAFFVLVSYSYAIGFGVRRADEWGHDPTALLTMANRYAGAWLVPIVFLAAVVDALAVGLGLLTAGSRVCYALARDRVLAPALARVHPRYQTPHVASRVILLAATAIGLPFAFLTGGAMAAFAYLGGIGALITQVIYMVAAVAVMAYFPRRLAGSYSLVSHGVAPVVILLGCGAALYGSLQPPPGSLFGTMPYVAVGLIAVGPCLARQRLHASASTEADDPRGREA
jgi:amino acid transporter